MASLLTSAITRIIQWIGMYNAVFIERFKGATDVLEKELPFKVHSPKFFDNLVVVGDLIRESIAHEVALKISETSYLPDNSGLNILKGTRRRPGAEWVS